MRTVLVIRRAHSTDAEFALASQHVELTKRGREQVTASTIALVTQYGIIPGRTATATSEFERAKQTAALLGCRSSLTTHYPQLNEVSHGMRPEAFRAMLYQNYIPQIALETAKEILDEPPPEDIWVTHGLLIAALCALSGVRQQYRQAVPGYCEIRPIIF